MVSVCSILIFTSCTTPARDFAYQARELGFTTTSVPGTNFTHIVVRNRISAPTRPIHVYIDGDGRPWLTRSQVSPDPTSRDGLILRLMALDSDPSVLLGRPCYHGQSLTPACVPLLWTHGRYSEVVVASMAAAIETLTSTVPARPVILIGYSGGGTLALLIASRLHNVQAVVTIAGNLDTDSWTARHGYSPLSHSLNPADQPLLPESVAQLHLIGDQDTNTPIQLHSKFFSRYPRARILRFPSLSHAGPWENIWPDALQQLNAFIEP